jgi:hypothetical protein
MNVNRELELHEAYLDFKNWICAVQPGLPLYLQSTRNGPGTMCSPAAT